VATALLVVAAQGASAQEVPPDTDATASPAPVLAYYYIWFNASSWNRAKTDYPTLGRYSSDERSVLERHVEWAQAAGIDGFVVSWKHTDVLDARLELLIDVAEERDFHLSIIYQGLDFERRPLPVERVADDLELFADRYASSPAFDLFERPLVVWSGTWEFTPEEVGTATTRVRDDLLVLASERDVEGIERLAGLVDGDAYYWASVNPGTYPDHAGKLAAMSAAVDATGGLWIAPAAPGFDARLVGGTSVVERSDGEMLRRQWDAAVSSAPDAVGLISWNEFSENTHLEPSETYGDRYLEVVRTLTGSGGPGAADFDSSEPAGREVTSRPILAALMLVGVVVASINSIRRRGARAPGPDSRSGAI
jgi:hypothetical protein